MKFPVIGTITSILSLLIASTNFAQGPEITSWIINPGGETGYGNIPSNVLQVQYTSNDVYVSCASVPAYAIGPWAGNPNEPSNQQFVFKITRNPVQNTGTPVATSLGQIGVWKNGVVFFNPKDAMSYNNQGVWNQNAIVVEGPSFDNCLGHPAPNGCYHTHLNPECLYDETVDDVHSPLLGYAFDGFPVYGAWAYANSDGSGGIARMRSSYQLRDITVRHTLPDGTVLNATQYGPNVNAQYPLGYYIEDYEYIPGLGDLDEHNGRFCVTPEYPQGIYCYFVTIDAQYNEVYPYIIGPAYYGTVAAGNTGPNGGHNTVPGNASTYNPTGVYEAGKEQPVLWWQNGVWHISASEPGHWQIFNTAGQVVTSGFSATINDVLPSGIHFFVWHGDVQSHIVRFYSH